MLAKHGEMGIYGTAHWHHPLKNGTVVIFSKTLQKPSAAGLFRPL
jgi:hypothetical protein